MLDYGRILTNSATLFWQQRRAIWPILLLFSLSGLLAGVLNLWIVFDRQLRLWLDPDFWLDFLLAGEPLSPQWVGVGFTAVLVVAFSYWLLITFAEGGLVGLVLSVQQGKVVGKTAVFRWGRRLLWRFLAIDAIIFIPPFLLLFLALLIPSVAVVATVWLEPQAVSYEMLALPLLIGATCSCLLLLVALPLLPLTLVWRTLALRQTAVSLNQAYQVYQDPHTIRAAIGQSWQVARRRPVDIFILAVLLWGAVSITHILLNSLTWPLFALLAPLPGSLSLPLAILLILLRTIPQAVVQGYFIVAWTVGYTALVAE